MSKTLRLPNCDQQALLDQVQVRLVERAELERFKQLLDEHHYLGSLKAVGERLHYVATDAQGQWLALLVFSAPAKHLKHRDQWIGWSAAQRHRRLSLVTNNSRFLILPERSVPNLASKVLRLTLDRLPTDWQSSYGHPVLVVEQKVSPPCTRTVKEIRSMVEHFKAVPDFRGRFESYPLWSMLTILLLATLCGAPRGQKDIAKFARGLSQAQRRALGIRRNPKGKYPAPTQPTFCRLLQRVDARRVEEVILAIQEQMRGSAPKDQLIVLDGKEPRHGSGASILSAVTVPSQHYLGSALVDQKTNEIPVARELFNRLELEGRLVSLDALHTQDETARALVLEHGADYLLTVKGNQPTVREQIETLVAAPQGDFPPS